MQQNRQGIAGVIRQTDDGQERVMKELERLEQAAKEIQDTISMCSATAKQMSELIWKCPTCLTPYTEAQREAFRYCPVCGENKGRGLVPRSVPVIADEAREATLRELQDQVQAWSRHVALYCPDRMEFINWLRGTGLNFICYLIDSEWDFQDSHVRTMRELLQAVRRRSE